MPPSMDVSKVLFEKEAVEVEHLLTKHRASGLKDASISKSRQAAVRLLGLWRKPSKAPSASTWTMGGWGLERPLG
jgi:hypothetical protein